MVFKEGKSRFTLYMLSAERRNPILIEGREYIRCKRCDGTGIWKGKPCKGTGQVLKPDPPGDY